MISRMFRDNWQKLPNIAREMFMQSDRRVKQSKFTVPVIALNDCGGR